MTFLASLSYRGLLLKLPKRSPCCVPCSLRYTLNASCIIACPCGPQGPATTSLHSGAKPESFLHLTGLYTSGLSVPLDLISCDSHWAHHTPGTDVLSFPELLTPQVVHPIPQVLCGSPWRPAPTPASEPDDFLRTPEPQPRKSWRMSAPTQ